MSRLFVIGLILVTAVAAGLLINHERKSLATESVEAQHLDTIRQYERAAQSWETALDAIRNGPGPEEDKLERFDKLVEQRPDVEGAVDAAIALLESDPARDDAIVLARFLMEKTSGSRLRGNAMLQGMLAIAERDKAYAEWPQTLLMADVYNPPGVSAELDQFIERFDQYVEDLPVAQATARYYAARRRMTLANWIRDSADDRFAHRDAAKRFATGLSLGVEGEELFRRQPPGEDGEPLPYPTFAEAEKELLFLLSSVTVGGVLPNAVGQTLAGEQDELAHYRGKTVLLDFWATWCAPCIEALPKLAELKTELPEDVFEIVSVNTDASLQTLLDFRQQEPMPWVHWYVGENAPLLKEWFIRGFPAYLLIDQDGTLLAKQYVLNDALLELIRTTSCETQGDAAC